MLHLQGAQIWELLAAAMCWLPRCPLCGYMESLLAVLSGPWWVQEKKCWNTAYPDLPLKASSKGSTPVASSPCGCLSSAHKMTKLSHTFFRSFKLLVKQFSLILQYHSCLLRQHLCLNCRLISSVFSKLLYLCSWPWHVDTQLGFFFSEDVRDPGRADGVVSGCGSGKMTDEI